jgi:Fe-S cluster assembly protein SufD
MTATVEEPLMTEEAVHARDWLARHGLPTGREEDWKYTPVDQIRRRLDDIAPTSPAGVTEADLDLAGRHGRVRIVLVDGVHVPGWSTEELPTGLWCGTTRNLSASMRRHLTTPTTDPPDGFEALNRTASEDVVYLLVADGAQHSEPVHVVHLSTGARITHPRLVVDVGAGSHLPLIESHVSLTGAALTNASTTIRLAAEARATVHRVQDEHPGAFHVGRLHLQQRAGSHSTTTALSRGAAISRLATIVELLEPAATCTVTGLLVPQPGARHDDVVTVDHAASRCTSDLRVRAVVPEQARTSSSGHVIVRPGTAGTVVHQRADALLLDRTAQADSRPWLEIFSDDLRAAHGSATGRLDEDALFYLRSRGIPLDEARSVLVGAFARTIVEQLEPRSLRDHVAGWFGWEEDA